MGEIVLLGLLIGFIFYELTDISPGGLVVPGMIAYYIYNPSRILMTIVISIMAYAIVKIISSRLIIYGKRKFVVHIIVATLLSTIVGIIGNSFDIGFLSIPIIGYIIPGIISNEMNKQGPVKTIGALGIVSLIVGLLVLVL